jgi:very-short-patch-repair endonuclease
LRDPLDVIDDGALRDLASRQHGLVASEQAVDLGYSARQRHLLSAGARWERVHPRVLRLVGTPQTVAQGAMCGVLEAGRGAALNASSASAWWNIPGNRLLPLQVVRPRDLVDRPVRSGSSHEPTLLPPAHIVILDGIPTVVPARALFDVAGSRRGGAKLPWWVDRMARMVDAAWSLRLVSGVSLHAMLDELAERGRPGIRVMRQVLADRDADYVPPASGLESRVVQILERAGLPPLRRQVNVGDGHRWIGRVDFRDAVLPLVVEVQSERFHTSRIDEQLDAQRTHAMERAGFEVVELIDTDVWHRPRVVVERVAAGRRAAERRMRGAA